MHPYQRNRLKNKPGRMLIFSLSLGMMILFLTAAIGFAKETIGGDHFALGNVAYARGDYNQAITEYNAALDGEGYTPSLLYNLGNAYYMKNDIGKAILNYERALYLDPGNADIQRNLALARRNSGLENTEAPFWQALFTRLTLNGWTWISAITLGIFALVVLINGIRPRLLKETVFKTTVFLSILLFVGAGAGIVVQYRHLNRGVITTQNAQLRVSPFESADTSGVVKGGKMVNLADTYEGYVLVKTSGGKSGWIPRGSVTALVPKDGNHQAQTALTQSGTSPGGRGGAGTQINNT